MNLIKLDTPTILFSKKRFWYIFFCLFLIVLSLILWIKSLFLTFSIALKGTTFVFECSLSLKYLIRNACVPIWNNVRFRRNLDGKLAWVRSLLSPDFLEQSQLTVESFRSEWILEVIKKGLVSIALSEATRIRSIGHQLIIPYTGRE